VTKPLSPALLVILGPKHNWVTTLTFLRHVTSSGMWPFDSAYPISYWYSIVTKPLSPAFLVILGPKYNWVTTLTFLGHVTSSVMWPFDSTYPISYSCSIVTRSISLTVFEILGSKLPVLCKSSSRMLDITWRVPAMQNLGTYLQCWVKHFLHVGLSSILTDTWSQMYLRYRYKILHFKCIKKKQKSIDTRYIEDGYSLIDMIKCYFVNKMFTFVAVPNNNKFVWLDVQTNK